MFTIGFSEDYWEVFTTVIQMTPAQIYVILSVKFYMLSYSRLFIYIGKVGTISYTRSGIFQGSEETSIGGGGSRVPSRCKIVTSKRRTS